MTIIEATSGTYRSRVDGTIVLSVEIEPRHAKQALELFGMPGTALALAALKDGSKAITDNKPAGGPLAKLSGMWCREPKFWEWLETDPDNAASSERGATLCVHAICGVESRAMLDNDPVAARKFQTLIREPYMQWLKNEPVKV